MAIKHLITLGFGGTDPMLDAWEGGKWFVLDGFSEAPQLELAAHGTLTIDGTANFVLGEIFAAHGTLSIDGTASFGVIISFAAHGAPTVSGAATFTIWIPWALLLNSVLLPYPDRDGVSVRLEAIGVAQRTPASLTQSLNTTKRQISIRWSLCTTVERTELRTAWQDCRRYARSLRLPDGQTYTVVATGDFEAQPVYCANDAPYYGVALAFAEV